MEGRGTPEILTVCSGGWIVAIIFNLLPQRLQARTALCPRATRR